MHVHLYSDLVEFVAKHRLAIVLALFLVFGPCSATWAQQPPNAASLFESRAEREAFLSKATIVTDAPADGRLSWRVSLDDGARRHDAFAEAEDGSDPTGRDYRFNLAAYALDKALELHMVPASVERTVNNRPASLIWAVDDVAMSEQERRRQRIVPPDLESWNRQTQAMRVFDELISNTYRDTSPALYLNSVWDNLLITRNWTVWLVDHTGAFRTRSELQDGASLARCPRGVLRSLRGLNRDAFQRMLRNYLSPRQMDALEVRRKLLVKLFDEQIASKGEAAVLYELPARR